MSVSDQGFGFTLRSFPGRFSFFDFDFVFLYVESLRIGGQRPVSVSV